MRRFEWLGIVLVCAFGLGCESSKQIGSACKDNVCPQVSAVHGVECTVSDTAFEVAFIPGDAGVPHDQGICLPSKFPIEEDGIVDCSLYVTLNNSDAGTDVSGPQHCTDAAFLETAPDLPDNVCRLHQLTSKEHAAGKDGWYYDSAQSKECLHGETRIVITDAALPIKETLSGSCLSARIPTADAGTAPLPIEACGPLFVGALGHVGEACEPPPAPAAGFDDRTATLLTRSDACGGGSCLVYRLRGDPAADCKGENCADRQEASQRVYCTCRCDAPAGQPNACECPQGFSCQPILENGPDSIRGSFCVREGT